MSVDRNWKRFRRACSVIDNTWVQNAVLVLIFAHAIALGVQASSSTTDKAFDIFDRCCLVVFSVEIVLQLIHRGVLAAIKERWLAFDIVVIVLSWALEMAVLRSLRVLGVVRLTSRLSSLQEILKALAGVFPSLMAILALLVLVLYVYAVLCTNLFADLSNETDEDYFGSLDRTFFTLFQIMTLADWHHVVEQIADHYSWSRYIFITFMVFTSFILYSLITAVVCEAVSDPRPSSDKLLAPRIHAVLLKIAKLQERQEDILHQCQNLRDEAAAAENDRIIVCIDSIYETATDAAKPESHPLTVPALQPSETETGLVAFRNKCGWFVNSTSIQWTMTGLIVLNAITLGLGTFDSVAENDIANRGIDLFDRTLLGIFTLELLMQILHSCSLSDAWLRFDLVVIIASWSFEQLQVARAFRICRIVRLGVKMETLRELLQALVDVAPSVSAVIALLMLIIYIYAVLCTALLGNVFEMGITSKDFFGRIDKSAFTLFQMTTLENWAIIVREIDHEYTWAWFLFTPFIVLTSFMLYSIMIAVICDAVAQDDDSMSHACALKTLDRMVGLVENLTRKQLDLLRVVSCCERSLSRSSSIISSSGSSSSVLSQPWSGQAGTTAIIVGSKSLAEGQSEPEDEISGCSDSSSVVVEINCHRIVI